MKQKITILLLATVVCANAFAQKPSIGIAAGVVSSSWQLSNDELSVNLPSRIGFTAGLTGCVPLSSQFSLIPAANFVQKGFKMKDDVNSEEATLNYLEIPVNLAYNNSGFFVGAGPAISFGLSGNRKEVTNGQEEEEKIKFGSGIDDVVSTEYSANFLTGYQFKNGFMISANYNLGLSNLMNGGVDDGKITNRYFGFRIGYMFMKK